MKIAFKYTSLIFIIVIFSCFAGCSDKVDIKTGLDPIVEYEKLTNSSENILSDMFDDRSDTKTDKGDGVTFSHNPKNDIINQSAFQNNESNTVSDASAELNTETFDKLNYNTEADIISNDNNSEAEISSEAAIDNSDRDYSPYILNDNSKKFHYSYCESVSKMKEKNKLKGYDRDIIISQGFAPCKMCNP